MKVQPVSGAESHAEDIIAIAALVKDVEKAQQQEQPEAFTGLFQADTVWTTAHGKRLVGRAEIDEFTKRVLPGAMRESTATYDIEHILFVRPDVAVVNVRQRPITLDGAALPHVPEGRPVYVLAKNGTGWQIAAGQNTQVKET